MCVVPYLLTPMYYSVYRNTAYGAIPGPGITCELSFCLWISSLLQGFFFRFTIFLLHKNQHSKFQFNPEKGDKKSHFMECPLVNPIFFLAD